MGSASNFVGLWSKSGRSNLMHTFLYIDVTAECHTLQFCCSFKSNCGNVLIVILLLKVFCLYVKVSLIFNFKKIMILLA